MRLLKLVDGKLSFVDVPTHNNVPYAILSHTWTPNEEVTYQEILANGGKDKSGYRKIVFCGEQAMKDGLLYFWVDTCCINKQDTFELSTAINSMFRWYRNATRCYVFLADVSISNSDMDPHVHRVAWEAAFRSSKWFTRGWTLQELIAPATVDFYSKEARHLCNKQTAGVLIHEITRIPPRAFQGNHLSEFSVIERKKWAAQRQTTYEEDLVYCLLGLCEVSMPAIYGEGKTAAWKRFDMTVRGFSNQSEVESTNQDSTHFIVPFERNSTFTGRESQLTWLKEHLFEHNQTTRLAVFGLGGIGKTSLVVEFVYRTKEKFKDCSVFWIPTMSLESVQQAYTNIAQQLQIPGLDDSKADIKRLMQNYLSQKRSGQWILVFDNSDDTALWFPEPKDDNDSDRFPGLIEYLPKSEQGAIVFTTRDRKLAVKLAQTNMVEVPQIDDPSAQTMFKKRLHDKNLVENVVDMRTLLEKLANLPLAIVQAAAYINANGIAFTEYVSLLNEQEDDVIELLSQEFEDDGRYRNTKNPVAITWLISFEQMKNRDPLAAEYLSFMACIDFKNIPQSILPAGPSLHEQTNAIGTLAAYSFVSRKTTDSMLDMHRLVHLTTRNWLKQRELLIGYTQRVLKHLLDVFPEDDYSNRSLWRLYLTHADRALASSLIEWDEKYKLDLAWKFGSCLYSDGRWTEAEVIFLQIVEVRKKSLGPDNPITLTSMANLAAIYSMQGRSKEGEELGVTVIKQRKKVLGHEHPDTLASMANLSITYAVQGRWKEAAALRVTVIEISKKILGHEHPDTLASMSNLIGIYSKQGRYTEAEDLSKRLLQNYLDQSGPDHPHTLMVQTNLAIALSRQEKLKDAEQVIAEVIQKRVRVLGQKHPLTLQSLRVLAVIRRKQGQWDEAEQLGIQVLETSRKVLGRRHPQTIKSMAGLAFVYQSQGRIYEALTLLKEASDLSISVLGSAHPETISRMEILKALEAEHS